MKMGIMPHSFYLYKSSSIGTLVIIFKALSSSDKLEWESGNYYLLSHPVRDILEGYAIEGPPKNKTSNNIEYALSPTCSPLNIPCNFVD